MKEHDIDKLFKNKTSKGNFDYSESYWHEAEKLLNGQNNGRGGGLSKHIIASIAILVFFGATILSIHAFEPDSDFNNSLAIPAFLENNAAAPNNKTGNKTNKNISKKADDEIINQEHNTATNTKNTTHKNEISSDSKPIILQNNEEPANAPAINSTEKNSTDSFASRAKNNLAQKTNSPKTEIKPAQITAVNESEPPQTAESTNTQSNLIVSAVADENDMPEKLATNRAVENTTTKNTAAAKTAFSKTEGIAKTTTENTLSETEKLAESTQASSETNNKKNTVVLDEKSAEIPPDYPQIKPHRSLDDFTISAGPSFSYFLASRSLSANSNNYQDLRNDNETTKNINSLGVDVHIGYRNWLFSTGIFRTSFVENINYPGVLNVLETQDNSFWQSYDNWSYTTQTNWVIDSIYVGHLQTDTTWSVTQDSTFILAIDSTYTEKEVPEMAENNGKRTVSYVEIPVWFGRSFGANRFTIDVQGGVAFGFLTTTQGAQYINYAANTISTTADVVQQNTILYNAMLRAGVRFNITEKLDAGVYPTLRYNLNSVLKGEGINQRYFGYGLQVGLFYRF